MAVVWRIRRTATGVELPGSAWFDVAFEDEPAPKRLHRRVFPLQPWEQTPGQELAPVCIHCGSGMVWRGTWQCNGCAARGGYAFDGAAMPRALPREALAGVPLFSASEGNNSTATRAEWLWSVESLTSMHRRAQAARLLLRGTRPTEVVDADGVATAGTPVVNTWHAQRVKGQAERFERVQACGTFTYALDVTSESGEVESRPLAQKCDCWRVCHRCLQRRKYRLQTGIEAQRTLVQRLHRSETHPRYRGDEGKWSEKLITFTVPHGADGPASDARALVGAWQLMLRRIRTHLVERGCVRVSEKGKTLAKRVPWCRALEVATRGEHHAHMHVWWYGPYLESALLQVWWGQILADAGVQGVPELRWGEFLEGRRQSGHTPDRRLADWLGNPAPTDVLRWGIVDIRADGGGNGAIAAYTQKVGVALYVVKGTDTSRIAPAHAAAIYEVFEGTRAVQWAMGWAPPKKPLRALCITFRRLTEEEKVRLNHVSLSPAKNSTNTPKNTENSATSNEIVKPPDKREQTQPKPTQLLLW